MKTIPNVVTLLWSHSQDCYHIEDMQQTISKGREACIYSDPNDWILIGVFDTDHEAHRYVDHLEKLRGKRKPVINEDF